MATQSTHRGTCQACGRVQKLPGQQLSLHGYTKQWGFFSGSCPGSRHDPFEVSRDLIVHCIRSSEEMIRELRSERSELTGPTTYQTKAWRRVCVEGGYRRKSTHEWKRGQVTEDVQDYGATKVRIWAWTDGKSTEKIQGYEVPEAKCVADVIADLNLRYVESIIDPSIRNHERYIEWQQKRIEGWKPKALLPVSNEREDALAGARSELELAGCERRPAPYGISRPMGWWKDKRYLGRDVKHALAALRKIQEGSK